MRIGKPIAAAALLAATAAFALGETESPPISATVPTSASEPSTPPGASYHSATPAAQRRAFFGELHLHTTMSFDAWTFDTKVTPDEAYRFGRGETIMVPAVQVHAQQGGATSGEVAAKRAWPLDFMAVTDHSEAMGVMNQLDDPSSPLAKSPVGQAIIKNPASAFYLVARGAPNSKSNPQTAQTLALLNIAKATQSAWALEIKAANDNYIPGKFTTFIGYEWSSLKDGKYNLHRNVFFNSDHAPLPFSSAQSDRPEDLWSYLEKVRANGIDVLAIPHNGNVSGGLMYDWNDSDGRPIDEHYAQRRALNEPLNEIVQNKGQSDTVPALSPSDEFARFEIFDHLITWPNIKSQPDGSYIRQALGRGLVIESKVGTNPYKFGLVGASDIHNGLSASSEDAFAGEAWGIDPKTMVPHGLSAKRAINIVREPARLDMDAITNHAPPSLQDNLVFSSAGITGVWAEENTRNSIFAALKRKETFATSGTRIRVRMFAGWSFDPKMTESGDWVSVAYATGVPMGSDLPAMPAGVEAPRFVLQAVKDPDGANLDRIQIIKLWLENGSYKEKIYNVALSGNRRVDPKTGKAPSVGNSVNLKTGGYKNTIGASVLTTVWQDPEFDAKTPVVYYARVLEIPTPRWSTLLAVKNHLPIPSGAAATIQERAWTSPIWFTPG